MEVQVNVTSVIQKTVGGQRAVTAEGGTVAELIDDIELRYPGFRAQLVDEGGQLHRFVNIYLNDEDVRFPAGRRDHAERGRRGVDPAGAGRRLTAEGPRG